MRGKTYALADAGLPRSPSARSQQLQAPPMCRSFADSLAGPMLELKRAFEAKRPGTNVVLTSGVSRQLAERILRGDSVDVFAPSSPSVIDEDLMSKPIGGTGATAGKPAAGWYVVFSANEMVVITAKGNPLGIRRVSELARPGLRFVRINGEKDLATARTISFLQRGAAADGEPTLAQKIIDGAPASVSADGKPVTVPAAVDAVKSGKADAAVVYYSAAVAARKDIEIVRFADSINMSELASPDPQCRAPFCASTPTCRGPAPVARDPGSAEI